MTVSEMRAEPASLKLPYYSSFTVMLILQELAQLLEKGEPCVLCTVVRTQGSTPRAAGSKMVMLGNGKILGTIGGGELENRVTGEAKKALADGKPRLLSYEMADPSRGDPGVCGGQLEVFVEPILPQPTLVVVGGGHVGKAVVHLGSWLGFRVVLSDDRPEFCTPEAVPNADVYLPQPMNELVSQLKVNRQTYFVLCTRNVNVDVQGLPALLTTDSPYIGVIGSRRRWATTRKKLIKAGIPAAQVDRVRSPMGLELNAETPEEIALSILAEIVMERHGGHGRSMSESVEEINE